jgi:OPA family glycerol-3-phosphate transporter-like MFS transporter 1/2
MLGSGACVALFGAAYFWNIHSMSYFIVVQVAGGETGAAEWEAVVCASWCRIRSINSSNFWDAA